MLSPETCYSAPESSDPTLLILAGMKPVPADWCQEVGASPWSAACSGSRTWSLLAGEQSLAAGSLPAIGGVMSLGGGWCHDNASVPAQHRPLSLSHQPRANLLCLGWARTPGDCAGASSVLPPAGH